MRDDCVSPSRFCQQRFRQYWWKLHGKKFIGNIYTRSGTTAHELLEAERGIETMDTAIRKILDGKEVYIGGSEYGFCSPSLGIRGYPDALHILYDNAKNGKIKINVIEDKPYPKKGYLMQASTYAWMLSKPDVLYGENLFWGYFPEPKPLDIDVTLNFWASKSNKITIPFIRDNKYTIDANIRFAINKKRLALMNVKRIKNIEDLPLCEDCPMDVEKCNLWMYCETMLPKEYNNPYSLLTDFNE